MSPVLAAPTHVRLEHLEPGDVVHTPTPRVSWRLAPSTPGALPSASELELAIDGAGTEVARLDGPDQILVAWPFDPLASRTRATLRVRIRVDGDWSAWSAPLEFETPLLDRADWRARFITADDGARVGDPAPEFVTTFELAETGSARLFLTALGVVSARINGRRVGEDELSPGWTDYRRRLRFRTHDVGALLVPGRNELAITVGDGWYRGRLAWDGSREHYGSELAVLAQLEVLDAGGSRTVIGTGPDWRVRDSAIVANDLYDGCTIDLTTPEAPLRATRVLDRDLAILEPQRTPPLRELASVEPVALTTGIDGVTLVDFGENLVGWVELEVAGGARGQRIVVRHAEVLVDGALATAPLRSARARDEYVLADGEPVVLRPEFTFHGFRYAEISGVPIEQVRGIRAVVVGSRLRRTGWFETSDARLTRLHENVVRSARGNLFDIPIDCPQRDERLGWTGDIQLFAPAASYLFDVAALLDSWLEELRSAQAPDGSIPSTAPDILRDKVSPDTAHAAGFADAIVVVPSVVFERYADPRVVDDGWDAATRWMARSADLSSDVLRSRGFQWGDWLDPAAPADDAAAGSTPHELLAAAYLCRTADLMAELADASGRDAAEWRDAAVRARRAFRDAFATPRGLLVADSVTAYAMAIAWDLLEDDETTLARMVSKLRTRGYRVSTGFLGTPVVLDALSSRGRSDLAARILFGDREPSWFAQLDRGATTMWERWDGLLPDGTINAAHMISFNHYAFGSIADWMHREIGGIAPASPGYRSIRIAPFLVPDLEWSRAALETPYGRVAVDWRRADGRVAFTIEIPPGTTADVDLGTLRRTLVDGVHEFEIDDPVARSASIGLDTPVGELLDDARHAEWLVGRLVALGAAVDPDDAARRLAAYHDLAIDELASRVVHPAFTSAGEYVRGRLRDDIRAYVAAHGRT